MRAHPAPRLRPDPLPVALLRDGETDNRAAARRLNIGGLDPRRLEAWPPAAKPRPLGVTIVSLPAACHTMTGGAGPLVHDRHRASRIDEEGRIGAAMTIALGQELVAAVLTGGYGDDTVLLTQDAWHASPSCRGPRNQLRWSRQVPGRSLRLVPGEEGRFWWQTLDGHKHVGHVFGRNGNNPLAVQLPAHATAAGFASADGCRRPARAVAGPWAERWQPASRQAERWKPAGCYRARRTKPRRTPPIGSGSRRASGSSSSTSRDARPLSWPDGASRPSAPWPAAHGISGCWTAIAGRWPGFR